MVHMCSAPARWPALLFLSLLVVLLQACSVLRGTPAMPDAAAAGSGSGPAFALDIETGDDSIRDYLAQHMELQRFRQLPDLQTQELARLLGAADDDVRGLLATLGYFSPDITISLHDSPRPAKDQPARSVQVRVAPGPRTHVAGVDLTVVGDGAAPEDLARRQAQLRRDWRLPPGTPFTQQDWDAAKAQGLHRLQALRYPQARIAESRADVDADKSRAELSVHYDSGPAYRFGPLQIRGGERYDSVGTSRIARLPTGEDYSETRLLDAQQRLASSGYYDAVFLTLDTEHGDPQAAPVIAQVRDARLQKLVFGVGISTDTGARLTMDHIHNRLPGLGWRAVTKVSLDHERRLLSTDWTALPAADGWRWFTGVQLQREVTGSFDVDSTRLRAGRTQNGAHIDRSYFLQHDTAKSSDVGAPPSSSALSANYGWTGRYFNNNTAPTRGWGLAGELGVGSTLRPARDPFVRAQLRWQSFIGLGQVDMGDNLRRNSRLSLRLEGGALLARGGADIPATELFLTGGDTTVRGYGYRSIGARINNGELFGGRYMAVGSVEWQRPISVRGNRTDFESAMFIDAGAVADKPGDLSPRVGVGAGLRWRSPVGPLQADLGYGLQSHQLRLHLRLGYTF
ncbi:MAG: BamA/TamA family outer membrane protein [Proteobacteria bacterium]|nr:BamA/TamA family outer membrane protein [Pseudomonadota bacterium]